jgi:hypothetical protein
MQLKLIRIIVVDQILLYRSYNPEFAGGATMVLINGTIILYGATENIADASLDNYLFTQQSYSDYFNYFGSALKYNIEMNY